MSGTNYVNHSIVDGILEQRPHLFIEVVGDTIVGYTIGGSSLNKVFSYTDDSIDSDIDISDLYGIMHDVFDIPPDAFKIAQVKPLT